jgi:hypothetical protein
MDHTDGSFDGSLTPSRATLYAGGSGPPASYDKLINDTET